MDSKPKKMHVESCKLSSTQITDENRICEGFSSFFHLNKNSLFQIVITGADREAAVVLKLGQTFHEMQEKSKIKRKK